MINFKNNKILITLIVTILVTIGTKMFIYDNPKALYVIAEGLDEPSSSYYWVIERIYRLSRNESETKRILNELESGKNEFLHDLYIRTIGIVGENSDFANYVTVKIYTKYQGNDQKMSIVASAIDTMGFIANKSTISILERLVENYDNHNMVVAKYPVVRALYLSTCDIHMVREKSSMEFNKTDELKMAREVITRSKGRYRTFDEMLILSNLNRPDRFKCHSENDGM